MKILLFEYLCGGGCCQVPLPAGLAREGALMLNALIADFAQLPEHEIVVLQDWRQPFRAWPDNAQVITVSAEDEIEAVFAHALQTCDAAWLIAPETDGLLYRFAKQVEQAGKQLLSPPSRAIAQTADKWQTFALLSAHGIATVATQKLLDYDGGFAGAKVIKAFDGVGCEDCFFIPTDADFTARRAEITSPERYLVQPYLKGENLSLSALFQNGSAFLLCVNQQQIIIKNQCFSLLGCVVNVKDKSAYQPLVKQLAQAMPDLSGYVGLDVIHAADGIFIVDINPRLTSSYAGIGAALGVNVAQAVLKGRRGALNLTPLSYQSVTITIAQEE